MICLYRSAAPTYILPSLACAYMSLPDPCPQSHLWATLVNKRIWRCRVSSLNINKLSNLEKEENCKNISLEYSPLTHYRFNLKKRNPAQWYIIYARLATLQRMYHSSPEWRPWIYINLMQSMIIRFRTAYKWNCSVISWVYWRQQFYININIFNIYPYCM